MNFSEMNQRNRKLMNDSHPYPPVIPFSVHIIWEDMILKTREKEHFHRAMLLLHDRVDHKLLSLNFQKTLLCNL